MIGIYSINNIQNGKRYIGQSKNIKKRIQKHFQELRAGKHKNSKLQHAFTYYGANSFICEVLVECTVDELDSQEIRCITLFDTVSNGYNLETGGNKHKTLSEETKRKIALWNIGRKHTEETKEKIRKANVGKPGVKWSESKKLEKSISMKGKKIRLGKTGQKLSEETRKKMSIAKIGNTNAKGSKRTPEEIANIIEANKKRVGRKYQHRDSFYISRGLPIPNKD